MISRRARSGKKCRAVSAFKEGVCREPDYLVSSGIPTRVRDTPRYENVSVI